jgi:hypothetical protein
MKEEWKKIFNDLYFFIQSHDTKKCSLFMYNVLKHWPFSFVWLLRQMAPSTWPTNQPLISCLGDQFLRYLVPLVANIAWSLFPHHCGCVDSALSQTWEKFKTFRGHVFQVLKISANWKIKISAILSSFHWKYLLTDSNVHLNE